MIANTTESEFKSVLQGLCNQTKGFKKECLTIVDEYYDVIYKSLVTNLDDQGMCFMIGVCPKGLQDKKVLNLCAFILYLTSYLRFILQF